MFALEEVALLLDLTQNRLDEVNEYLKEGKFVYDDEGFSEQELQQMTLDEKELCENTIKKLDELLKNFNINV
jgi:hypothetical protein